MSLRFEIQLDQEFHRPGDTVKGTVLVAEGGRSRALQVFLEYKEEVEDYLEVATSISSGPLHSGELATGTSFEFELPLPENALPNYQSEHGELFWELDVKSDESGRDTHERRRIEIAPPASRSDDGRAERAFSTPGQGDRPKLTTRVRRSRRGLRGGLGLDIRGRDVVRWVTPVFLAVGVLCIVIGAVVLVRTMQFVAKAEHATGTVIELTGEIDSEGDELFFPVVRFTTADGKEIEFESSSGSSPASHSTGDRVEVLYDPDDPNDAQLSGFVDLWLFTIIFFLVGGAFLAVGWFSRGLRP